tara:strand:- start:375 stop:605 length:231 start_codon:yes stop_codon:yes gene_type:complete
MLDRNVTLLVITTGLGVIGAITYSWASWTTETLIAVDKRTEVMATQIEFIKVEMEKSYGYVPQSDETTSIKAASKE